MLQRDKPVRMPSKPPSMIGFGVQAKRLLFVAIVIIVLAVLGFLPLIQTQFEAKTLAKTACNDIVRHAEYEGGRNWGKSEKWKGPFLGGMRAMGVQLTDEQYSFEVTTESPRSDHMCEVQVAFDKVGQWPYVSEFIDDLPPLVYKVRLDFTHRVRRYY